MPLTCLYSLANKMVVVSDNDASKLLASGEWFNSRKEAKEQLEKLAQQIKEEDEQNERQIRRKSRKRRIDRQDQTQENGS